MSVTSNVRCVLWALLAVMSPSAVAQEWNISVGPEPACPSAAQLNERLQTRVTTASTGRWSLVVTRPEAQTLNVELTRDGQLIGRRKLTTAGAACPDLAQTVALLVSSWVSSSAQGPAATVTSTSPKPPARPRAKRSAPKPSGEPEADNSESEIAALDVSVPPDEEPAAPANEPETATANVASEPPRSAWALRAMLGAHWTSGVGAQAGLWGDVGAGDGWGLRVGVTLRTPVTAARAGGTIGWWGGDAVIGFRSTQDFFGIAQWEWAVVAGGRFTALVPSGFDEPAPRVVFAPIAGVLLGARVPLSETWSFSAELGVTAQPWEERWVIVGAGAVPVSWLAGSLSVGIQRAFF